MKVLVIHAGAGPIKRTQFPPERQAEYRNVLRGAVMVGWEALMLGGVALDAVEAAVAYLEDAAQFNAGRGSVYTRGGHVLSPLQLTWIE
jgi:beta-aspartyl-peptidase (threonine type)